MSTPLRPMTAGELLDRTFNLYRQHFVLFWGIALVPQTVPLLLNLWRVFFNPGGSLGGGNTVSFATGTVVSLAVWLVAHSVSQAATVFAVSGVHLGRETSIRDSYAKLRGRLLRVIGVDLLTLLALMLAFFVIIFLLGLGLFLIEFTAVLLRSSIMSATVGIVLVIIGFISTFAVNSLFAVSVPACVLEDLRIRASLRRSIYLTKNDRRRVFVISVLYIVLWYGTSWALVGPLRLLAESAAGETLLLLQVLTALATFIAQSLAGPIGAISMALIYYDERVRKEAFDLELMVAALDRPAAASAAATV